jgi:hypothetical protein
MMHLYNQSNLKMSVFELYYVGDLIMLDKSEEKILG